MKGDVKAISGFYFTGFLNLTENLKIPEGEVVAFKYSDYGIDPARMQRAIEQVVTSFELASKPTVAQVFNGAYLPPASERKPD